MTDMFFTIDGVSHRINSPDDLQNALGNTFNRSIVMTDETGAVVGRGSTIAELNSSVPMMKSLRESSQQPIRKAAEPRILFAKGKSTFKALAKSHGKRNDGNGDLHKLIKRVEQLKKADIYINEAACSGNDDAINDLYDRVIELENTLNDVTGYLDQCISAGILPGQV
jgi:hypothetical protein